MEPFGFVDDVSWDEGSMSTTDNYLEGLSATEWQDLIKRFVALIANDVE